MKADEEDVVEQQPYCREFVSELGGAGEDVGCHVADVSDFWVSHVELPQHIGSVQGDEAQAGGQENAADDAKDRPCPRKSEYG